MDWRTVDRWEAVNAEAGNDDCTLCVGSGFFAFFEADQRPGNIGMICDCIAGATMPIAMQRFLAEQGYAMPQALEIA